MTRFLLASCYTRVKYSRNITSLNQVNSAMIHNTRVVPLRLKFKLKQPEGRRKKGGKQLNKVSLLREFHLNKSAKETSKTKIWVWQNEGVVFPCSTGSTCVFRNQTGIEAINKCLCKYIPTF